MPVYNYRCRKCGKIFDSFQRVGENSKIKCVYCGSEAQRVFSPVGIILKGSGFYTTDYKSSHKKSVKNTGAPKDDRKDSKKSEVQSSDKKAGGTAKDKKDKNT